MSIEALCDTAGEYTGLVRGTPSMGAPCDTAGESYVRS